MRSRMFGLRGGRSCHIRKAAGERLGNNLLPAALIFSILNCFSITFAGSPDILICGNCREMFSDLVDMMEHKRDYCKLRFTCKCDALNEENDGSPCTDCTSMPSSQLPSSSQSSTVAASTTVTNHGNNTNNWNFLPPHVFRARGDCWRRKVHLKKWLRNCAPPAPATPRHSFVLLPTSSHATISNRRRTHCRNIDLKVFFFWY